MNKWIFVGISFAFAIVLFITFKIDTNRELPYSNTYGWGSLAFVALGTLLAIFKK